MKMTLLAVDRRLIIEEATIDNGLVGDESGLGELAYAKIQAWAASDPGKFHSEVRYQLIHTTYDDGMASLEGRVANPLPDNF